MKKQIAPNCYYCKNRDKHIACENCESYDNFQKDKQMLESIKQAVIDYYSKGEQR